MFYTQLFAKRGPLAKIWLAAHWERKITKAHVFDCNLEAAIKHIVSPEVKIGLRTSGHLLFGVVRIFSRKAKYLLADCNEALANIRQPFRPDQTDMPMDGLEATEKTITLTEDFTALDAQLPLLSDMDIMDNFSLHQSRSEEITLTEDFEKSFLSLAELGDENQNHQTRLLDLSVEGLGQPGDAFGDEDKGLDLLGFLTNFTDPVDFIDFIPEEPQNENPEIATLNYQHDADRRDPAEVETPALNETTVVVKKEAFALEPVPITSSSEHKRGKRKRKLVVDQTKELSDHTIRKQLDDCSDLIAPTEMAPPTRKLMQWKESGNADNLFAQPCSSVVNLQIKELYDKSFSQSKCPVASEEVEEMRQDEQDAQRDMSSLTTDSGVDSITERDKTRYTEVTGADHSSSYKPENDVQLEPVSIDVSGKENEEDRSGFTYPELPSEDSMFVHPSCVSRSTQCLLDGQDLEERKMIGRARSLLDSLKSNRDTTFSLEALCAGSTRSQVSTTFYSLLFLEKQHAIRLHQSQPYDDITATPGSKFFDE